MAMPNDKTCPNCGTGRLADTGKKLRCPVCGWRGQLYIAHPDPDDEPPAENARMEDAVCANHPTKKAVAICAGTGDYICSLCRLQLHGRDYSVQYLDRGGRVLAQQNFSRLLPRPDRAIFLLLIAELFLSFAAPLFFIISCFQLRKALAMRQSDPIYRKIMPRVTTFVAWTANLVISGAVTVLYLLLIFFALL